MFLCVWEGLIINKKHFSQLKILNMAIQSNYEMACLETSTFIFEGNYWNKTIIEKKRGGGK